MGGASTLVGLSADLALRITVVLISIVFWLFKFLKDWRYEPTTASVDLRRTTHVRDV
jgi:hypothetical protein